MKNMSSKLGIIFIFVLVIVILLTFWIYSTKNPNEFTAAPPLNPTREEIMETSQLRTINLWKLPELAGKMRTVEVEKYRCFHSEAPVSGNIFLEFHMNKNRQATDFAIEPPLAEVILDQTCLTNLYGPLVSDYFPIADPNQWLRDRLDPKLIK